jgi:hypothetical protein
MLPGIRGASELISSAVFPHWIHVVADGIFTAPQNGQMASSKSTVGGLKHTGHHSSTGL